MVPHKFKDQIYSYIFIRINLFPAPSGWNGEQHRRAPSELGV